MWRVTEPQKAPPDSVYEASNALLDDEGSIYRRGGSTQLGTVLGSATWRGFAFADVGPYPRYLGWNVTNNLVTFDDALSARISLGLSDSPPGTAQPIVVGGMVILPSGSGDSVLLYGGTQSTTTYSTGTIAFTEGSRTVTGTGTSWTGNVSPGAILYNAGGVAPVESVESNTSLTIRIPAPGDGTGVAYQSKIAVSWPIQGLTGGSPSLVIATAGNRLVAIKHNRAVFSHINYPTQFDATDYHLLPAGVQTLGATSVRDTLVWFTTRGVWTISNMAFDLTDDLGNVQHQVSQPNRNIVLWGHPDQGGACGVVGWNGTLIVPAQDDVHVMALDGTSETISDSIRPLYRSYVKAGYLPGAAQVYNGHYILPIIDSNSTLTPITVLVCKLQGTAWTQWSAESRSFTVNPNAPPTLLSTLGTKLVSLTNAFTPGSSVTTDADGTAFPFTVTTRDLALYRQQPALWKFLRARYELEGSSTLTVEKANGSGSYSALSGSGGVSDGTSPAEWSVDERSQAVRFRLNTSSAPDRVVLRSLEAHVRPTGKR